MERARLRFYATLAVYAAWVAALGFLGFTSAEPPRPSPSVSKSE